jgi:protein SCO1
LARRLALVLAVAVAAGCGGSSTPKLTVETPKVSTYAGSPVTPQRHAPAIALHDAWGRPVSLATQRGRWVLVTFLYVHCPDVCPLIAQNLNAALRQLGPKRDRVRVLAVSVDPIGDTPRAVKRYVAERGLLPQFRYLIGSKAQLTPVWAAWHVLAVSQKPDVVDHVAYTVLVDPRGRMRLLYDAQVKARQVVHDLRLLTA